MKDENTKIKILKTQKKDLNIILIMTIKIDEHSIIIISLINWLVLKQTGSEDRLHMLTLSQAAL